jgi:hypothetical protein
MSNYPDANGQPVLLPNEIHSNPINQVKEGPAVILTDKGFNVNVEKAENDYKAKIFLAGNNSPDSYSNTNQDTFLPSENPFPTFASYLKFIVEKEYLKSVYKEETDSFLTQRALMTSFNRAFIMGTTKYSYTDLVMNTISEFEDQNLKFNYPVLSQLSPARFEKEVNILELNDRGSLSAADATDYYKNLKQLADPSVRKVRNSNKEKEKLDNARITDVFKNFSLMMFYQHGFGYSPLGFNKILEAQAFTGIVETASASFLANNLSTATLDQIFNILNTRSNYKNYAVNPKDYTSPEEGLQNVFDEFTDNDWENLKDFIEKPGTSKAESGKVLEGDIFALPGIPVITTNLGGVHGAGLAQAAKAKGLIVQGDGNFKATDTVVQLPVKKVWSDSMAMNNNMDLLKESLRNLIRTAREKKNNTYLLPHAGLGHGE